MNKLFKISVLLLLIIFCVIVVSKQIKINRTSSQLELNNETKQGQTLSGDLFDVIYSEYTGIANTLVGDTNLESYVYYKIIDTESEYNKYEKLSKDLPSTDEINFEKNSIIIISKEKVFGTNEKDIVVTDTLLNGSNVEINLQQNNLPNYELEYNVWYVIVENTINNININLKFPKFPKSETERIDLESELLNNYTVEQAIQDGCIIIDNNEFKSESEQLVENFFVDVSNNEDSSIRIYKTNTTINDFGRILVDIVFKNGLTYIQSFDLDENKIVGYTVSKNKITKNVTDFGIIYDILNGSDGGSLAMMYIKK